MKMPEPFTYYRHYDEHVQPFADENTVPLYDKQALIELLEEAAKECEEMTAPEELTGLEKSVWDVATLDCAVSIRKLKETL